MKWKSSLGFALIFLFLVWSMTNQTKMENEKRGREMEQRKQDSLAALAAGENADSADLKGLAKPVDSTGSKAAQSGSESGSVLPPPGQSGPPSLEDAVKGTPTLQSAPVDSTQKVSDAAASADLAAQDSATDSATVKTPVIEEQSFVVENEHFIVTLNNRGAMVKSIVLKALPNHEGEFPELLQKPELGALSLKLDDVDFSNVLFAANEDAAEKVVVQDSLGYTFTWSDQYGRKVIRYFGFTASGQDIHHYTVVEGFKPNLWTVEWNGGMRETEKFLTGKGFGFDRYFFSEVVVHKGYNVLRETLEKKTFFNENQGSAKWFGMRRKYVAGVINFDGASEASIMGEPLEYKKKAGDPGTYRLSVSDYMTNDTISFRYVILPLVHSEVQAYGQDYDKIIFSGWEFMGADTWFVALCGFILWLLNFFYGLIPNYGVAIILLTLVVKFITLPMTLKQLKSTQSMQKHKPAIDKIRKENRANPQKAQQEMMAYYKKAGINPLAPMAGCFTMILQMPIFISLFVVLGRAMELRWAPFFGWMNDLSLPDVVTDAVTIPYLMPLGLSILPFLMAFTTYVQTKQSMTDPNMKTMVYIMPIMMLFFAGVMPSGLVVYWIVSNLFSITQYWILNRNRDKEEGVQTVRARKV